MDLNLLPPAVIESLLEQRIAKTHVYSTLLPKLLARLLQNLPGTGAERTLALLRRSVPFCGIQALRCIPVACLNVLEQAGNDDLPEDVVVALAEAVDDEPSILSTLPFWTKLRIYPSNHSAFLSDMKCLVNSFAQDYRVLPSAPTFEDVRDLRSFKTIADSVGSNNGLWDGLTNLIETCFRENADKSEAIAFLRHCLLSHLPLESTLDSFITLAHLLNKPRLDLSATRAFFDRVPKDCVSYARAGIILSTERAMQLLVGQFLDTVGSDEASSSYLLTLLRLAISSRELFSLDRLALPKWHAESAVRAFLSGQCNELHATDKLTKWIVAVHLATTSDNVGSKILALQLIEGWKGIESVAGNGEDSAVDWIRTTLV